MSKFLFPIDLNFHIGTFANDFSAINSQNETITYVRQKMFKFVEEIEVFSSSNQSEKIYDIKADRWLDFSATYSFFNSSSNSKLGFICRKGWASLWRARYELHDTNNNLQFNIQEDNPFVKVLDALIGQIPIVNFFVGYFFNPSYSAIDSSGMPQARITKTPSFFGRKFRISSLGNLSEQDAELIFLGFTMLVLLERRRG